MLTQRLIRPIKPHLSLGIHESQTFSVSGQRNLGALGEQMLWQLSVLWESNLGEEQWKQSEQCKGPFNPSGT